MTLDELRAKLDDLEGDWTEEQKEHLGDFGLTEVLVDYWRDGTYAGLGPAKLVAAYELGVLLLPAGEHRVAGGDGDE